MISAAWMTETYRFDEWRGNHGKKYYFTMIKIFCVMQILFLTAAMTVNLLSFVWSMEAECTSADMFDFACSMFYGADISGLCFLLKKKSITGIYARDFRGKDLSGVY